VGAGRGALEAVADGAVASGGSKGGASPPQAAKSPEADVIATAKHRRPRLDLAT
jgi:hypothetical protein